MSKYKHFPARPIKDEEPQGDLLKRPKLLFVAIFAPTFSPKGMIDGFEKAGFDVVTFDWRKVKFNEGIEGLKDRIVVKAQMEKPDLIFLHIQNSESIGVDEVVELQKIAPTINYTFDVREDMSWFKELAPHISYTYLASLDQVKEFKKEGIKNVGLMQSSCDMNLYKPGVSSRQTDILFIGQNYSQTNLKFPLAEFRQEMCKVLDSEFGDKFQSYGMRQKNNQVVLHEDEVALLRGAKIVIAANNFDMDSYQSDRIWRSMATGAFVLAHHSKGIEKVFEVGKHLDTWKDFDELVQKVKYYLANEASRNIIAKAGMDFVRNENTWAKRFENLYKHLIYELASK